MQRELCTEHALHVFLEGDPPRRLGATTDEDEDGRPRPIAVPARGWFVRPLDLHLGTAELSALIDAITAAEIPGLSLASCRRLGDDAAAIVARATDLEYLDLFNTTIGDAGLPALAPLARLRALSLAGTRVTDAGLPALAALPALASLDLSFTDAGDAGALAAFPALPALRALSLRATRVTDLGLPAVAALPLRELDLQETAVTDAGVTALRPLAPTLELLLLGYTRLTDACAADLSALGGLRTLSLRATRIAPDRDRALAAALPRLGADGGRGILR